MKIIELAKSLKDSVLPHLFEILHSNMSKIAPTGNSYEEDYAIWSSCIITAMEKEPRPV